MDVFGILVDEKNGCDAVSWNHMLGAFLRSSSYLISEACARPLWSLN
jgi:hypothetical protein